MTKEKQCQNQWKLKVSIMDEWILNCLVWNINIICFNNRSYRSLVIPKQFLYSLEIIPVNKTGNPHTYRSREKASSPTPYGNKCRKGLSMKRAEEMRNFKLFNSSLNQFANINIVTNDWSNEFNPDSYAFPMMRVGAIWYQK